MRTLVAALVVSLTSHISGAAESSVMLEGPGQLEALRKNDSARYEKVMAIFATAEKIGCGTSLSSELHARFGVSSAKCAGYSLMTEPQKARLTFTLDRTQYTALVRQGNFATPKVEPDR